MDTNSTVDHTTLPGPAFTKEEILVNSISAVSCLSTFFFLIAAWWVGDCWLLYMAGASAGVTVLAVLYAVFVLGYHYALNKW